MIQYVEGIGALDLRTWIAIAFGGHDAIRYYESSYAETFLSCLLPDVYKRQDQGIQRKYGKYSAGRNEGSEMGSCPSG